MDIFEALKTLNIEPFFETVNAEEKINSIEYDFDEKDKIKHLAYTVFIETLRKNSNIWKDIQDEKTLNSALKHLDLIHFSNLFDKINPNINKIIKTKGQMIRLLDGLHQNKLKHVVEYLRLNLSSFQSFAEESVAPPKPVDFKHIAGRLVQGKLPHGDRMLSTGIKMLKIPGEATINNALTRLQGRDESHHELNKAIKMNQIERDMIAQSSYPKKLIKNLTHALATHNIIETKSSFEDMVRYSSGSLVPQNDTNEMYWGLGLIGFSLAAYFEFTTWQSAAASAVTLLCFGKMAYDLTQNDVVHHHFIEIARILSELDQEYRDILGQGLACDFNQTVSSENVKQMLMDYCPFEIEINCDNEEENNEEENNEWERIELKKN